MEIRGKIINILPMQEGTSKAGNPWKKAGFVLETGDQYPRKVAITIFGEERINNNSRALKAGLDVVASIDIESREFNGRWYTDVNCWKVIPANEAAGSAPAPGPVSAPAEYAPAPAPVAPAPDLNAGPTDDLPF